MLSVNNFQISRRGHFSLTYVVVKVMIDLSGKMH